MLYKTYEVRRAAVDAMGSLLERQAQVVRGAPVPFTRLPTVAGALATADLLRTLRLTHDRPDFGIGSVLVDGEEVAVHEEVVTQTAFGSLLRFRKEGAVADQPKVLVVPGLAGHFATLVRATVATMLTDHDVYVADWHNARDVPVSAGPFGLDDYIGHLIDFLREIGPGTHLLSVCQPAVACLVAAAVMAEDREAAEPASLILLAGPVDTRVNPSRVSRFAQRQSISALERTMLHTVPPRYRGAGRRVYPGFLQVSGFMGMDPRRHARVFRQLHRDLRRRNDDSAQRTIDFYDEYFAVLDIDGSFYLETVRRVFQDHDLPRGEFVWRGRAVDPSRITSALFTIEGALDEMCPPGQTHAAHALTPGIPAERRRHLVQEGVGHYGVFAGSRFDREIYPQIREFVSAHADAPAPRTR